MEVKTKRYIIAALRKIWLWSPERKTALSRMKLCRGMYICECCKKATNSRNIQVDHIAPVSAGHEWTTWDDYINRLYCDPIALRAICKSCHQAKTAVERSVRVKKPRVR